MNTAPGAIACFIAASLLGAVGQFLYKTGADASDGGVAGYLLNWRIWIGVICYVAVMVLFIAAFRIGGRPSVLYPIYATTFIWAAMIGWWAYGEPIRPIHISGMAMLILGMFLMGR